MYIKYKGWVARWRALVASWLFLVMVGGCSIAGQWHTSQRELPQRWTISEMTLSADGLYTATDVDLTNTETGRYEWTGSTLTLQPIDGPSQVFSGRVTRDGALLLSEPSHKKDTVRYEKVGA